MNHHVVYGSELIPILCMPAAMMLWHSIDPASRWAPTILSMYKGNTGNRALCVIVPVVWNSLLAAVCHTDNLHSFKCRVIAFLVCVLVIDSLMPFISSFTHEQCQTATYYYFYYYVWLLILLLLLSFFFFYFVLA